MLRMPSPDQPDAVANDHDVRDVRDDRATNANRAARERWVATVPPDRASEPLRNALAALEAMYPPEYGQPIDAFRGAERAADGGGIVLSHSLIPDALFHAFATFGALMSPDLPLTRCQHELIAAVVSTLNGTRYCSVSHVEFLRRVTGDATLADSIRTDYRTSSTLSAADRVMLDHAAKLTTAPSSVTKSDIERLRAAGFDDRGIVQLTLIAAWFNYINRVADGLGVGR
jgi:uncharacterized peroxidase-related enzyme